MIEIDVVVQKELWNVETGVFFLLPINGNFARNASWNWVVWFHHLNSFSHYLWVHTWIKIVHLVHDLHDSFGVLLAGFAFQNDFLCLAKFEPAGLWHILPLLRDYEQRRIRTSQRRILRLEDCIRQWPESSRD